MSAREGSNKFQAWHPLYEMEFFMYYSSNTHAMVMTKVVLVLSPLD